MDRLRVRACGSDLGRTGLAQGAGGAGADGTQAALIRPILNEKAEQKSGTTCEGRSAFFIVARPLLIFRLDLCGDAVFGVALDAGCVVPDGACGNLVAALEATRAADQLALLGDVHVVLLRDDGCSKSRSRPARELMKIK